MRVLCESNDMDVSTLDIFLKLVHTYTGITMTHSKKTLLQRRITPRIKKLGLTSYASYIDLLNINKNEIQEFVNLVTTHETSFFRTQRVWDYFNTIYLPSWHEKNMGKTLKIWSAASSTGEETFTIGICCEDYRSRNPSFTYNILGTDISTDVLSIANKGNYSGRSIESFKNSNKLLFDKYLRSVGEEFNISNTIKKNVRFDIHNLYKKPLVSNVFDIVFLRNVLIYFDHSDQSSVLENMSTALVGQGILIIGESESLTSHKTSFDFISPMTYTNKEKS